MVQYNNIKTLIFDLGGVLINLDKERCIEKIEKLGIKHISSILDNFIQQGIFIEFEKGIIGSEKFRNELRKLSENTLTDEEIDKAWCAFLVNIPDEKIDLLLELRKKFKILMLSNTNSIHIQHCKETFFSKNGRTLSDCFDKCYFSYELGCAKPDKKVFEMLLQDAQLNPEECLFLDDGKLNIEQANRLGFRTYLVKPQEKLNFLLDENTWKNEK